MAKEAEKHYPIKLSTSSKCKLFCMHKFSWLCCNFPCCSQTKLTTNERLRKLYGEGTDRVDTELGVEKILKDLRDLRIYINQEVLDEKAKYKI